MVSARWFVKIVAWHLNLYFATANVSISMIRKQKVQTQAVFEVTEKGVLNEWNGMTLASSVSNVDTEKQPTYADPNMIRLSPGLSTISSLKAQLLENTGFAAEAFYAGDLEYRSGAELQRLKEIASGEVNKSRTEIVLAHYDEDLRWTAAYKSICSIYTKSPKTSSTHEIRLPNVGREGHTFLYHIVNNYDSLAEWTIFSQAGEPTSGYQGHRLGGGHMLPNVTFADYVLHDSKNGNDGSFILFTSVIDMDSLFVANRRNFITKKGPAHPPRCPHEQSADTWDQFKSLDWFYGYLAKKCGTTKGNLSNTFKDYWQKHVSSLMPQEGLVFYAQGARFAMSKDRIRQRPRDYYVQLLNLVSNSSDPCANYFNEWTWFYMIGEASQNLPCADLPSHSSTTKV